MLSDFKQVASVPADAPREFEFTFEQEIPINASDLYLQVVFRGVLGQEQDAVVVATHDISEPTYFSVMNSTDYVELEGHVYLRTQVAGSAALTAKVRPVECINADGTLFDGCLHPTDSPSTTWSFRRSPTAPNGAGADVFILRLKTFSRLAFLTNASPDQQELYQDGVCSSLPTLPFAPDMTQWNPRPGGTFERIVTPVKNIRGIYSLNTTSCVLNGDYSPLHNPFPSGAEMQDFFTDNRPVKFHALRIPPISQ